ncbi:MAG: hypothetical protein AB1597_05485 [Chloroflexota bacterium]
MRDYPLDAEGRIGELGKQDGKAHLGLLLVIALLGGALLLMAFLENAGAEVIGGILGGLVVAFGIAIWHRFRTFEIRFYDSNESIAAENMKVYTAVRTDVGKSVFNVSIKPRLGMELKQYGFAFFDRGKLPWLIGCRRVPSEICVTDMGYYDDNARKFENVNLTCYENEGSFASGPMTRTAAGTRRHLQLTVIVASSLKMWEGILSFKLFYDRDGNPETKHIRTKFFVRPPNKRKPIHSLFKKVLRCYPVST